MFTKRHFILLFLFVLISSISISASTSEKSKPIKFSIENSNLVNLNKVVAQLKAGDILILSPGKYANINLVVTSSGTARKPIIIKAEFAGKTIFCGDAKVELRGEHITLEGILFTNGNRNPDEWSTHGPGLVAMYGSYNRITQCAFHAFDQANSAYITTSLTENGDVPQHCRIDHCSFTEKITFDQVINLNNVTRKDANRAEPGIPMYHRIDHCYFSNPKKPGNAGGGIRVGYWRADYGRCLIDNNLFERQDSEPEIITSKSMENIYYNNTFKNCAGTLNFRHGDKQVAINNFFIGTDELYDYGGMFVWGSNHIIANNYFNLPTTLKSRGSAALFLNCGAVADEHALAFDIKILNNIFSKNNGYAINFSALYERRVEYCAKKNIKLESPRDLDIVNNIFISENNSSFPLFYKHDDTDRHINWKNNISINSELGFNIENGISNASDPEYSKKHQHFNSKYEFESSLQNIELYNIEGVDIDIPKLVKNGMRGKALTWKDVGPIWQKEIPGTYYKKGKLSPEIQKQFDEVTSKRK